MKRRACQVAAIWVAMILLVILYTDREAGTWQYSGEELALILQTQAQADAAEQAADEAAAQEKREATARREAGLWGKEDLYNGAPMTLPARTEDPGLNLMWGDYELTVSYTSPEALDVRVVSAGRQAFIEDGSTQLEAAQGASATLRFALTDATQGVMVACNFPENVQSLTVRRVGQRVFSPDLAAYAVLLGGVLTWLLVLSWDTRPIGAKRRRDALILVCAAAFASMPAMLEGLYLGHDLFFHLNRIEGIASALRCGQFPVRIHASTVLGYGYAASEFYPEAFLYLPAVMRNLGVSMVACVQCMDMLINLATALVCYASVRRMFDSREIAVCASVLYTLGVYRLVNLYTRATFGESLAMIFFPLMICAMVDVLLRDERRWPLLALSMTGVFMSHLLSTLFAVGFCALAALCALPRLVREPRRILACVRAAGLTVLCSLGFLVPFLEYSAEDISTSVVLPTYNYVQTLGALLVPFSGGTGESPKVGRLLTDTIGTQPGLAVLVGCALLLLIRYVRSKPESQPGSGKLPVAFLGFGTLAMLCSTAFFPWAWLCSLSAPYSTFFMQIQFPWRLIGPATAFLCIAAACGYLGLPRFARAGAALALALSVVFGGWVMQEFESQEIFLDRDGYLDSRVEQFEYTYVGTEKSAFAVGDVLTAGCDAQVTAFDKQGTTLSLELSGTQGMQYLELPLAYYPWYRAQANGQACSVRRGENNVIRLYVPEAADALSVRVWFEEPLTWRLAEWGSLAGFVLLVALIARGRRRA